MGQRAVGVGLVGLGTIGTGVVKLLESHGASLSERAGAALRLGGIADLDTDTPREATTTSWMRKNGNW